MVYYRSVTTPQTRLFNGMFLMNKIKYNLKVYYRSVTILLTRLFILML